MDRRTTLQTFFGKNQSEVDKNPTPEFKPNSLGLSPYSGEWTFRHAAHLLRRATFGPTLEQIQAATAQGLDSIVNELFLERPVPDPPVNYYFNRDPFVPIGSTWIDAPYSEEVNLRGPRRRSLIAWTLDNILHEGNSIREKMILFWHNHFAIGTVNDAKFLYRNVELMRKHAWGNFRDLVKEMTVDPSMLRFLNGNQNRVGAANENFARELLELYTIGKGPLAGPGDYTNYTEQDIAEMARALTGWIITGYYAVNPEVEVGSTYVSRRHDKGDKQLSARFDNKVISNAEENEYGEVVDIIFSKDEVARFISRKLYRWFVYYTISDEVEANIIEPMAQLIIDNDYELKPALVALLSSEHFFDLENMEGALIKNPIDFNVSALKQMDLNVDSNITTRYSIYYQVMTFNALLQMQYFYPPSVAGWPAYHQEPSYNRLWINASTFPVRMDITDSFSLQGVKFQRYEKQPDGLAYLEKLENPLDPNDLIRELAAILLPKPLSDAQLSALKEILIPGLPDFEWTVEYAQWKEDPSNTELGAALETKIRFLFKAMLNLPEFYLS